MNRVFINDMRTLDWLVGGTGIEFSEMNNKVKNGRFRDDIMLSGRCSEDDQRPLKELVLRAVCMRHGEDIEVNVRPSKVVSFLCGKGPLTRIKVNEFLLNVVTDFANHLKGITKPGEMNNLRMDSIYFRGVVKDDEFVITMHYKNIFNPTVSKTLEGKGLRMPIDVRYQTQRLG